MGRTCAPENLEVPGLVLRTIPERQLSESSKVTFVARHALWSDEQRDAAGRMRHIASEKNLEVIRLAFPDQHGILRGKTLIAS